MEARLTIAIPTFNRAGLLRRAIESALAQTSDQIEIFVSDNGSTDMTQAVISEYQDPRLRSIRRDKTVSRAQHGTLIFSEVTTELVLALSDDDYIEPNFASEIIRLYDEHPEISFAYSGCIEHYDHEELPALFGPRLESSLEFIAAHYAGKRQVSWCACVTRVADLRRLGPQPDDRICGDMYFWTQIAFQGPVGCVEKWLSHYTVLIPGGDNESRITPILEWANDVRRLSQDVMSNARVVEASELYQRTLRTFVRQYSARSIANQCIWARLYGMTRIECIRQILAMRSFRYWTLQSVIRIFVAFLLSRKQLRALIIRSAKRLSMVRSKLVVQ